MKPSGTGRKLVGGGSAKITTLSHTCQVRLSSGHVQATHSDFSSPRNRYDDTRKYFLKKQTNHSNKRHGGLSISDSFSMSWLRCANMRFYVFILLLAVAVCDEDGAQSAPPTALDVVSNIFDSCVKFGSFSCVKPKVLKFLSSSLKNDRIVLTKDMSIDNNGRFSSDWQKVEPLDLPDDSQAKRERIRFLMLEKIDNFLNSHELKVKLPKEIVTGEVFPFVPKFLLDNLPEEVTMPLSETKDVQERGLMKKVIVPFLLGLKIKATTFIPIAIALIALKTWKALTLGLLSLVLSAAMVIFKFAKPKVVNYEVYHYPSHHPPSPPIIEHSYMDHHGYGRSHGQDLAYNAHRK